MRLNGRPRPVPDWSMPNQFKYLLTALMFFTRIPWLGNAPYDARAQREALKYFPLIGWLVGAFGGAVLYVGLFYVSAPVAVVLALFVTVMLTGAMHEDGLADSVDAFGGGYDSERILAIMKDSRSGAFGVIALILVFAFKIGVLVELVHIDAIQAVLALMFTQAASRFVVLLIPASLDYVQSSPESKSSTMVGRRFPPSSVAVGGLFVAVPLLLMSSSAYWIAVVTGLLTSLVLARYFHARIGGYSGDCLGATQQISEAVIYLTLLLAWTSG